MKLSIIFIALCVASFCGAFSNNVLYYSSGNAIGWCDLRNLANILQHEEKEEWRGGGGGCGTRKGSKGDNNMGVNDKCG